MCAAVVPGVEAPAGDGPADIQIHPTAHTRRGAAIVRLYRTPWRDFERDGPWLNSRRGGHSIVNIQASSRILKPLEDYTYITDTVAHTRLRSMLDSTPSWARRSFPSPPYYGPSAALPRSLRAGER